MGGREFVEITEFVSGVTFRFYSDLAQPYRLHLTARWDVEPETAIGVFFDKSADRVWIAEKEVFRDAIGSLRPRMAVHRAAARAGHHLRAAP